MNENYAKTMPKKILREKPVYPVCIKPVKIGQNNDQQKQKKKRSSHIFCMFTPHAHSVYIKPLQNDHSLVQIPYFRD